MISHLVPPLNFKRGGKKVSTENSSPIFRSKILLRNGLFDLLKVQCSPLKFWLAYKMKLRCFLVPRALRTLLFFFFFFFFISLFTFLSRLNLKKW